MSACFTYFPFTLVRLSENVSFNGLCNWLQGIESVIANLVGQGKQKEWVIVFVRCKGVFVYTKCIIVVSC